MIKLSFEEAMKFNLAVSEGVRALNKYDRAIAIGKRACLDIHVNLDKQKVIVQEGKVEEGAPRIRTSAVPARTTSRRRRRVSSIADSDMRYMINVDVETKNKSGGMPECPSTMHARFGAHYDLTVHALECGSRNGRSAHRPPTRYWDDNNRAGYALDKLLERLREIQTEHQSAHPRRCHRCGVGPHQPQWD